MSPVLFTRLSSRPTLTVVGAVLVISLASAAYAWYDHLSSGGRTVAGNVSFAGHRLDSLDADEVRETVVDRGVEVLANTVDVETPMGPVSFQLSQLGFSYRVDEAERMILEARHEGGIFDQLASWATTPFSPIRIAEPVDFDPEAAMRVLESAASLRYSNPVNPGIAMTDDGVLVATIGQDGFAADTEAILAEIEKLDPTKRDLVVSTEATAIPPPISQGDANRVVDTLNELTRGGAGLIVSGHEAQLTPVALRRHISATTSDDTLAPQFNVSGLQAEIESLFTEPVGEAVNPTFEVDGESVVLDTPGQPAATCCAEGTAATLAEALLSGAQGPFRVRAKQETDPTLIAWYDGSMITEMVSTFTTPHNCCESRVRNIQRMADLVRGYYLVPGETLSLNEYIGPRTREKGFVAAGAIRGGHLTPEVGGGVSQFATTIFNAAYYAGLDFVEYQAHSQYFSRYPFGREATISNPAPDLEFENTTEYPVLIWTSYSSRSITVSMYSTKNVEAEQIAVRSSRRNQCTYVETDRLRTYSDGREVVDTFFALYRPADGVDCNGNPIPEL